MRFLTAWFFLFAISSFAQISHPADGPLYNKNTVARIDISINTDSLAALLDPANANSDHEFPANMYYTANGNTDTVLQVGFRLRGNTSRIAAKKSFKISINTFVSGRRYLGVKDMNLNGEHNDPSISRSRICWELAADLQLPASRTAHARLYINGVYYGLYINVEHINDDWLALRFGNNNGNLYKCTWPANLQFISNNANDYKLTKSNGSRVYELKTNETIDDYSKLAHFINVLNNTPIGQLECALDEIFNIEGYLKSLALEVSTGHWDNYMFNQNNYYLYENTATGKIEYLPYDIDNSLGVDYFNINWATRNVLNWGNPSYNLPLTDRLLQVPTLFEMYKFYLAECNAALSSTAHFARIDGIYNQIKSYAYTDTFKGLDYGFTNLDFDNSFDSTQAQQHVKVGIKTFFTQRQTATNTQLGVFNTAPIISFYKFDFIGGGFANIIAQVEDEATPSVICQYAINGGNQQNITLFDDGQHNDGAAADGIFGNAISGVLSGNISFRIKATDVQNKFTYRPCNFKTLQLPAVGALVINEFMADNDGTIQDNMGDYSDWIELYNNSADSIFLGDYYLTDKSSNPFAWQLPATYLLPHDFVLFWASENASGGVYHTNFKLSKGGEEIGLFKNVSGQVDTSDYILYGAQTTDTSFGRSSDADFYWQFFSNSTPGFSNNPFGVSENSLANFKAFPNPYAGQLVLQNDGVEALEIEIFNAIGQKLDVLNLPSNTSLFWEDKNASGLRILKITQNKKVTIVKLISN